jgi:hypothetical protein
MARILMAYFLVALACLSGCQEDFFYESKENSKIIDSQKEKVFYRFKMLSITENEKQESSTLMSWLYVTKDNNGSIAFIIPKRRMLNDELITKSQKPNSKYTIQGNNRKQLPEWVSDYVSEKGMKEWIFIDIPNDAIYHNSQYLSDLPPFNNSVYVFGNDFAFHEINVTAEYYRSIFQKYEGKVTYGENMENSDLPDELWMAPDSLEFVLWQGIPSLSVDYAFTEDVIIYLSENEIIRLQDTPDLSDCEFRAWTTSYSGAPEAEWEAVSIKPEWKNWKETWRGDGSDKLIDGMGEEPDEIMILGE